MGKRRARPPRRQRGGTWWIVLAAALVVGGAALGGAALWWPWGAQVTPTGPPRLVTDRTNVDLGTLAYQTRARATFELRNEGGAPLVLAGVPRVRAVEGC